MRLTHCHSSSVYLRSETFFGLTLVKIGRFKTALTKLEFENSSVDLDLFEHFFIEQRALNDC